MDPGGLAGDGELLRAIRESDEPSGIFESDAYGRVHWGQVALTGGPDPDHLVVIRMYLHTNKLMDWNIHKYSL